MILVTGGSGFVGRHLVQYLSAQGRQVRALYNSNPPTGMLASLPGVTWLQADLLDVYAVEQAMEGVTDVYHCAAILSFDPGSHEKMMHANPESTANVVNQALEQNIRKLVYISSVAAIGRNGDDKKLITEEEEWGESKYNSAYGISKYLAETEVWRGIGEGLDAVIINPGIILGAGDWQTGSAQLIKIAYNEFPFYTNGVNGWVDVTDVVKAAVMLMNSTLSGERYIVAEGNHSFRDIFTQMAQALHKRPPRYHAGPVATSLAWRLSALKSSLTGRQSAITRETSINAHAFSYYDNSKLLKALPAFSYLPISDSIKHMAQSFMDTQ